MRHWVARAKDIPPRYIYYTECYQNGKWVESRMSFNPEQFYKLRAVHTECSVSCKRMDMRTGVWERYPRSRE